MTGCSFCPCRCRPFATAPLANLQQRLLSKVARSVDLLATSARLDIDLGTASTIVRFVALARHNLTTAATYRIAEYSPGGILLSEARPPARVLRLTLDALNDAEAYGTILDAQRRVGTDGEVWVIPNWDDAARRFKRDFLARFRRFDPIAHPSRPCRLSFPPGWARQP